MATSGSKKKSQKSKQLVKKQTAKKVSRKSPGASKPGKASSKTDLNGMKLLLLDNCPDGIVAIDRRGIVRYVNAAAEILLKAKASKLVDKKFTFPFDARHPQEVSLPSSGQENRVAEVLTREVKWGREKFFVVSLHEITDRVRQEEQLRALSDMDPLTGLLNRRGFLKTAQRQLSLARRKKWRMTMFFLDLDGLKYINDSYGHIEGDQALIDSAAILQKTVREPDIIGRYAGDEFAILALETQGKSASGDQISIRLRKNLSAYNARRAVSINLSLSIGLAYFDPNKPVSIEALIDEADIKMYEEKRVRRRAR
jgi:diguanylate cyclase (GGDEF)-like protein